jgi:hypothetical protein
LHFCTSKASKLSLLLYHASTRNRAAGHL